MMFKKPCNQMLVAGFVMAALSTPVFADLVPLTLTFDDLGTSTNGGSPIEAYKGFRFDQGSYFFTALTNNFLITTNALTITRADGQAFYFDSLDYGARGGETREYFFLYDFLGGGSFSGASLNTSANGNFKTNVGSIETELSGTNQLITRLVVVGKQTETADYSYLALDNIKLRVEQQASVSFVPEPASLALFGLGLAGIGFSRRKRS